MALSFLEYKNRDLGQIYSSAIMGSGLCVAIQPSNPHIFSGCKTTAESQMQRTIAKGKRVANTNWETLCIYKVRQTLTSKEIQ